MLCDFTAEKKAKIEKSDESVSHAINKDERLEMSNYCIMLRDTMKLWSPISF